MNIVASFDTEEKTVTLVLDWQATSWLLAFIDDSRCHNANELRLWHSENFRPAQRAQIQMHVDKAAAMYDIIAQAQEQNK